MRISWIGAAQSAWDVAMDPLRHLDRKPLTALAVATGVGVLIGARGKVSTPVGAALQAGLLLGLHQLANADTDY